VGPEFPRVRGQSSRVQVGSDGLGEFMQADDVAGQPSPKYLAGTVTERPAASHA
jgi:hypothetical protein